MKTENAVWELLDTWINNVRKTEEAISSEWCCDHEVRICYSRIRENKLTQYDFKIPMHLLKKFSEETILVIMNDILYKFRE